MVQLQHDWVASYDNYLCWTFILSCCKAMSLVKLVDDRTCDSIKCGVAIYCDIQESNGIQVIVCWDMTSRCETH